MSKDGAKHQQQQDETRMRCWICGHRPIVQGIVHMGEIRQCPKCNFKALCKDDGR